MSGLFHDWVWSVACAGAVMPVVFRPASVPTMTGERRWPGGVISVLQSCIRGAPGVYVS